MYISEIFTGAPENVAERVPLEQKVYKVFAKLGIPYERVDNDPASSMEECEAIGVALGAPVRKDVFLCNQKNTRPLIPHPSARSWEYPTCLLRRRN